MVIWLEAMVDELEGFPGLLNTIDSACMYVRVWVKLRDQPEHPAYVSVYSKELNIGDHQEVDDSVQPGFAVICTMCDVLRRSPDSSRSCDIVKIMAWRR